MAFHINLKNRFRLFAFWTLVVFWTVVTTLKLLCDWLRNFGNYFYVLQHKRPAIKENWAHGQLKLDDITIHYVECGKRNGPLLLFVHGFLDFYYGWRYQLDHFGQQNYRVVAIDMRGYNDSSKPESVENYKVQHFVNDLREVINRLGNGKAILVGDGIGALVCWLLAEEQPELIQRLIVMNCPVPRAYLHLVCTNSRQLLAAWYWFAFQPPYLGEILFQAAQDYDGIVKLFRRTLKNKQHFTDVDSAYYKFTFSKKHGLTGPLQFFRAIPRLFDDYEFSTTLIKPKTLIIWGATNELLIVDGAHHSKAHCVDASLKVLPGGRNLQIDNPNIVNQIIEEYLNLP